MRGALVLAGLILLPAEAIAQVGAPSPKTYDEMWRAVAKNIVSARSDNNNLALPLEIGQIIRLQSNYTPFLLYVKAKASTFGLLGNLEDARTDKQLGAPANTTGSTSLVSKGAVPSILGFAVENGALTQSATATAVTLRGALVGWLDLLHNQDFIASYQDDAKAVRVLRAVSYSLTLNTSPEVLPAEGSGAAGLSPAAVAAQFEQIDKQLTSYSIRMAVIDQRDPRSAANREKVGKALLDKGIAINGSLNFLDPLLNSTEYEQWLFQSQYILANPGLSEAEVLRILGQRVELLRQMAGARIPDLADQVEKALNAFAAYNKARKDVFNGLKKSPLVTAEFVANRLSTLPDQRMLRLIAEGQWGPRVDLTGNIAWNFQARSADVPPGTNQLAQLRDFQASVQAEFSLGGRTKPSDAANMTKPSLAFAYLSQDVKDNAAVSFGGKTYAVARGRIHVAQAKITFPVKGAGVKIPFSISASNRTELIQEKTVRAHIGLTLDFDALAGGVLHK
ncbi:MAG: hypothetical protein ABMA15_03425 [Vicinamibacterales bacterium]